MTPPYIKALHNGQWVLKDDTHISRWAEQHGSIVCDPHLFHTVLRPVLTNSDFDIKVVWDIGAFIGDHTRAYLDMGKQVVAFEPNPYAFECLKHNCPEATLLNVAVSDKAGHIRFAANPNAGASRITDGGEVEVETFVPDDDFFMAAPDFVKIDAEGWEMHVLRGCEEFIRKSQPIVFIEVNKGALEANGAHPDDIFKFFSDVGYTFHQVVPAKAKYDDPQYDVLFIP